MERDSVAPSQFHRKERQVREEHRKGRRTIGPSHLKMELVNGFFAMGIAVIAFFAFQSAR